MYIYSVHNLSWDLRPPVPSLGIYHQVDYRSLRLSDILGRPSLPVKGGSLLNSIESVSQLFRKVRCGPGQDPSICPGRVTGSVNRELRGSDHPLSDVTWEGTTLELSRPPSGLDSLGSPGGRDRTPRFPWSLEVISRTDVRVRLSDLQSTHATQPSSPRPLLSPLTRPVSLGTPKSLPIFLVVRLRSL